MKIYKIEPYGFAANTYFVTRDGKNAVAVDAAQPRAAEEAARLGLSVGYVLLTHGHFDHIGGCAALQRAGARVGCGEGERELALFHDLSSAFGFPPTPPFGIDFTVRDGEEFTLAGIRFKTLATPGHTAGSVCYLAHDDDPRGEGAALFTGDTLFRESAGRCDLPTGDEGALLQSLKKLASLGFDCAVYAGHGEDSTLFYEKTHNGYLKC